MSKLVLTSIIPLLLTANLFAYDSEEAKELFKDAECMSCHNNEDFAPKKDKTNNFKKLHSSVMACQQANDAGWFDDEALNVSEYLNKKFYHFKEKK